MSKARINKPDGTKITIDGAPEEVARILQLIEASPQERVSKTTKAAAEGRTKPTMAAHVMDLKEGGFFKEKRSVSEVRAALEEQGHIYAPDSLGKTMLRLVRSKVLGRVKDKGKWMYVHRE